MPAVRLLLPFIAGIGICLEADNLVLIFSSLLVLGVAVSIFISQQKSTAAVYKWRYVSGIAIAIIMMSLGYILTYCHTGRIDPHPINDIMEDSTVYVGIVSDPVVVKEKMVSALLEMNAMSVNDSMRFMTGKVLASIVKDDKSEALQYGDRIIFTGQVKGYDEPKNPDQFNYKQYQSLHHIDHHVYLKQDDWRQAGSGYGNMLLARVYRVRAYFLSLIKKEVTGTNELAVATAIMLGYRDYVTDDVTQAYAGSGVLHVLSVSGLHVAVLYFVLCMLLGWMDRNRKLEIARGILIIMIMFVYAGLTGLSPPVLRSVWMFTLITMARLMDRDVSMYNVLGVSCLLLLLWDPYYIADVGFQLSYIAVAGIVYMYPLLSGLITDADISKTKIGWIDRPINWLTRWTWGLICVSIAAQIATFPISVFYFHMFPNYFLLANLLVIPLSNFVLVAGMILCAVSWSEWLSTQVGWVFDHLLIVLNKVVFSIDSLPFALSRGVMLTAAEMVMMYAVIVMIYWYIADRRARVLIAMLCMVLVMCSAFAIHDMRREGKRELVIYHISGKKAIAVINRGVAYYDFDSSVIHDEMTMRYNVRDNWYASGVKVQLPMDSVKEVYDVPFGKIYVTGGKRIVEVNKEIIVGQGTNDGRGKLKTDVLILSGGYKGKVKDISERVASAQVVFDTSCKRWQLKKWKDACAALNIKYHDCQDGAFVMEW